MEKSQICRKEGAVRKIMNKKKISRKKKVHIAVALMAGVVIIGAAVFTLFIEPRLETQEIVYRENTAQYGPLQNAVTESGEVEFGLTSQIYDLDISTEDDSEDEDDEAEKYLKIEEVYVAVGQRITEGEPVYRFTNESVEDVRKALTYAKTEAQIAYSQAQTEYEMGVLKAGLTYNETMLASNLAQTEHDNTIAKLTTQMAHKSLEIETLLSQIYQTQLSLVEDDYREQKADVIEAYEEAIEALENASEEFVTNRVEAAQSFLTAKSSYEKFFEQFNQANEEIDEMIEQVYEIQQEILYTQQLIEKDTLAAAQTLESANVSAEIADSKYSSSLSTYENSLNRAGSELEEATQKLEAFEAFVGDGTIYAQETGLITQIGYDAGDYLITQGNLLMYATSDAMTISVDVSQEDVVTMKVGDNVNIVFSAYETETYTGIIESITTTATSRSSATISYPVVISIQGDTSKLYGGMTADVTFITEETPAVIYALRKAIITQNGKSYLYKKAGEEYILSEVETGFTDGTNIEILSGLEQDETYYIKSVVTKDIQQEENSVQGSDFMQMSGMENETSMPQMPDINTKFGENMPQMPEMEDKR